MKILFSLFIFLGLFTHKAVAQNSDNKNLADTSTMLNFQEYKSERPLKQYLGRNTGNGTTLFLGRFHSLMVPLYKKGIWIYVKRAGSDPIKLMNLKSIEKYKGKRPKLKSFVYIGPELFAVAEYRRKGSRYLMLQELNINTGSVIDKPKIIVRQKVRGFKYHNKFDYDFYSTPDGTKVGLIYEQTKKKTRLTGDKKYILIDEDLEKIGKRTLKRKTKSAFNRKEKVSNKYIKGYNILNDGTLYSDVSENFRRGKELSLKGPSLLVYPIDTNYVVNVKLEDDPEINEESTIGSLSWWHTDTTYSALGVKYTIEDKKKKTVSQKLLLTNNLGLDKRATKWTELDYTIAGNEAISISSHVVDGTRVAIINHYEVIEQLQVNSSGSYSTVISYKLNKTNVLGLDDEGEIAWSHPIVLDYNYTTYDHHANPYVLFRKNDQIYFVSHRREYWKFIPVRSFYEIYRIKMKTGEVKYEKKKVAFRIPAIQNEGSVLNEHSVSAHRKRFSQWVQGKKVYEFTVY